MARSVLFTPTTLEVRMRTKVAVVATLVVLAVTGTAAAATGILPTSARRDAHAIGGATASTAARLAAAQAHAQSAQAGHRIRVTAATGKGNAQSGHAARLGLCRAWLAGRGQVAGKNPDAVAFHALTTAAGGSATVTTYCQALVAAAATGKGDAQSAQVAQAGHDATAAAHLGLCRAWLAGHGQSTDTAASQALATAAGGAGEVAGYCRGLLANTPAPRTGSGGGSPATTGH